MENKFLESWKCKILRLEHEICERVKVVTFRTISVRVFPIFFLLKIVGMFADWPRSLVGRLRLIAVNLRFILRLRNAVEKGIYRVWNNLIRSPNLRYNLRMLRVLGGARTPRRLDLRFIKREQKVGRTRKILTDSRGARGSTRLG